MSHRSSTDSTQVIPVLLLKTRSQTHDAYEEYLSKLNTSADQGAGLAITSVTSAVHPRFQPQCIPVLEHKQNEETLGGLRALMRHGKLKERYGGMIFTSQRAVEAWADTVERTEGDRGEESDLNKSNHTDTQTTALDSRSGGRFETDVLTSTPFPLYVVGPATARALTTLISTQPTHSPFLVVKPTIHGAETGSGFTLAPFILRHYNALHAERWFTWHDAPRLPFVPLLGMGSENYSRRRLEPDDPRLQKRPLLFLVGEQRRDIIPKTLMDKTLGDDKIQVEEVEVYRTEVRSGFRPDFDGIIKGMAAHTDVLVVVVFSPQGSGDMLQALDLIDQSGKATARAKGGWSTTEVDANKAVMTPRYVIVTIGPTTRDHLVNNFGFEPDVCAAQPTPEAVAEGVTKFLRVKGLV